MRMVNIYVRLPAQQKNPFSVRSQFVTSNILPNDCYIILNGSHNAYF